MKTAMQNFIENCITAMEHSKSGEVTYLEAIEVAQTYLQEEKEQIQKAYAAGLSQNSFNGISDHAFKSGEAYYQKAFIPSSTK